MGRSDPRTLVEFDRLWAMQRPDGAWYWPAVNGMLPFLERDVNYVATLVVVGAGYLPKAYLDSPTAKAGLQKAVDYLKTQPPRDLHAEMILLWASIRVPTVLGSAQRQRVIDRVRALQRDDGGWNLPSFGHWKRHDGPPNDPIAGPSDGYATALASFVLCQAGAAPSDSTVGRGLRWLEHNQRESGRWFTRSLYSDQFQNYLSTMGTAYAVLALRTCRDG
jgi:squalene-hopene/tetraprenyl-beta-curcumene cyclase